MLADQVGVSFIIWMNNNDATGTNHLGACCRNGNLSAVFTCPFNIDQIGSPRESFNFCICDCGSFDRIVYVRAQVFDDGAIFEQFNEN